MYKIILILSPALLMTLTDTKSVAVFAHNFNSDDNFFISNSNKQLTIENQLLNDSILHSNNNITLSSFEHIRNIENILEEIFISEDSFIVDNNQFYNNTIIALMVANLADEVLRNYGRAFGVP